MHICDMTIFFLIPIVYPIVNSNTCMHIDIIERLV